MVFCIQLSDALANAFDVPRIARGKFAATLALNGHPRRKQGPGLEVARGNVHVAALAIVDGVVRLGSFVFDDLGWFAGRRRRLELVELRNFGGVGFDFGGLGRLFLVETFGGIDRGAFGGKIGPRHGNARAADEIYFHAGIAATDAAPGNGVALDVDTEKKENGEPNVKKTEYLKNGLRRCPCGVRKARR